MGNIKNQMAVVGILTIAAVTVIITVAWATFNSTLSLEDNVDVTVSKWDIEFTTNHDSEWNGVQVINGYTRGQATINSNNPLVIDSKKTINGSVGNFVEVGDEITYNWYLVNFGTFNANASLTGLLDNPTDGNNVKLVCTSKDTNKISNDQAQEICDNSIYARVDVLDTNNAPVFVLTSKYGNSSYRKVVLDIKYVENSNYDLSNIDIVINTISFSSTQV